MSVAFYVSGHGFGHASRNIEVLNALLAREPDLPVLVRTHAPRWLFDLTVKGRVELQPVQTDVGVAQVDSLTPNVQATVRLASEFFGAHAALVRDEALALHQAGVRLVVSDISPIAFLVAHTLGVPGYGLGNFTWDWIYEGYAPDLGDASWLPRRLGNWYALADGAWRLPMHGGFATFPTLTDVPFVARRSRQDRDDVRARLGLDRARPAILESFGGFDLTGLPLDDIAARGSVVVVTTAKPARAQTYGALVSRTAGGTVVVDERRLYAEGLRYEDLVAAVDLVVTKPGYGIIAECIANDTAILYTSRGAFAEYDVLVRAMPRYLRCGFIDHADLRSGRWEPHVRRVLAQAAPPERPRVDGAEVVAGGILDVLAGRPAARVSSP